MKFYSPHLHTQFIEWFSIAVYDEDWLSTQSGCHGISYGECIWQLVVLILGSTVQLLYTFV